MNANKGLTSVAGMNTGDLYTTDGKDVWEIESFYSIPSVTIRNVRTGETRNGGVGCLMFKDFVRLVPGGRCEG